jgi:hypothetical protein
VNRVAFRALAVLFVPQMLAAQYIGLSVGATSSTVDWQVPAPPAGCRDCISGISPNANRDSWSPALVMQWRATDWLGIEGEARFAPKGYAITQPTLEVDYLEIPVLLRLGKLVNEHSPVSVFIEAGPAVAIRVQCEVKYNGIVDGCHNGAAFGQDYRTAWTDASAIIGIAMAVRIGDKLVIAGARYDWGLEDIGHEGEGVPTKNRSSLLYVSWLWRLHGETR